MEFEAYSEEEMFNICRNAFNKKLDNILLEEIILFTNDLNSDFDWKSGDYRMIERNNSNSVRREINLWKIDKSPVNTTFFNPYSLELSSYVEKKLISLSDVIMSPSKEITIRHLIRITGFIINAYNNDNTIGVFNKHSNKGIVYSFNQKGNKNKTAEIIDFFPNK